MPDLNKVFLMGRLTFDPELRRTPSGTAVAELRLATSRSWSGRDGERKEETLYIDITVWDRQAETCCQFLKKGSGVHVEGYLKMDTWDDKTTGEKRSKIRVQAERVQFLDRKGDGGGGGSADDEMATAPMPAREPGGARRTGTGGGFSETPGRPSRPYPPASPAKNRAGAEPEEREEEDIPF